MLHPRDIKEVVGSIIFPTLQNAAQLRQPIKKFISFVSFENIKFIYRAFQVWAWPLLDKRSTSKK